MPRVASQPRPQAPSLQRQVSVTIPLNDDRQEKASRLKSRQAHHGMTLDQIKGVASPVRRLNSYDRAASSSPRTPTKTAGRPRPRKSASDEELIAVVPGNSLTPLKRVPILANFEEWMKMATDNKINATNSWNFALIDYFHDMSLLKEGDGVNFQKASCTLDGCVKIYTSRVDSVATETGKLLSGLADSGNRKGGKGDNENEDEGSDEEGEDGTKKRTRKKRSSEATLVPSFAALRLKRFELEFAVDPLFKKASADFDEGGAKGLLLNHLAIDAEGRIVFDSCDDADEAKGEDDEQQEGDPRISTPQPEEETQDVDIEALGARFFPNLDMLAGQDICPSLKELDLGDPAASLDIPALKDLALPQDDGPAPEDNDAMGDGFGGDDDFDPITEAGFGEGGEAWAQNAVFERHMDRRGQGLEGGDGNGLIDAAFGQDNDVFRIAMMHDQRSDDHDNILSYFDQSLKKNWAGPEHWKIRKMKDNSKGPTTTPARRKEKEPFEIDFLAPLNTPTADLIYTAASSNSAISIPKTQWRTKSRNLLPDDKHFNSKQLLRLFLKPKAQVRSIKKGGSHGGPGGSGGPNGDIDEAYWAQQDGAAHAGEDGDSRDRYDADFFQDDGLAFAGGLPDDDDDFADARENFSPEAEGMTEALQMAVEAGKQGGDFGSHLVTQSNRVRPEYVQYARVAKKVDVRRLKEEMWKGMDIENLQAPAAAKDAMAVHEPTAEEPLKFTSVMNSLQGVYPKQAMDDISTSFCFICLLHLANEKGLTLGNEEGLQELSITRDMAAPAVDVTA